MTPLETAERQVIEAARTFASEARPLLLVGAELPESAYKLVEAVSLLDHREAAEQSLDTGTVPHPPPRPGANPILRRPKKLSRREQEIEKRRASDRGGRHRDDIDYSTTEDPSGI